jgi:hypothetical protein
MTVAVHAYGHRGLAATRVVILAIRGDNGPSRVTLGTWDHLGLVDQTSSALVVVLSFLSLVFGANTNMAWTYS